MKEEWVEVRIEEWERDHSETTLQELKARGWEPVNPLRKKPIVARGAFLLRCKRLAKEN